MRTGRRRRCSAAGDLGALLAVPALVATGRPRRARGPRPACDAPAPVGLRRLAEAALAAGGRPGRRRCRCSSRRPSRWSARRRPWCCPTPPTRWAPCWPGSPATRPRPSTCWAGRRAGRRRRPGLPATGTSCCWPGCGCGPAATTPRVAELSRLAGGALAGRDRLLAAAHHGRPGPSQRRRGHACATRGRAVEPVLARRAVDLFTVEAVEELAVAATRLRRYGRVAPVLDALDGIVAAAGPARRPGWSRSAGSGCRSRSRPRTPGRGRRRGTAHRRRLPHGDRAPASGPSARPRSEWARVLAGEVDPDAATAISGDSSPRPTCPGRARAWSGRPPSVRPTPPRPAGCWSGPGSCPAPRSCTDEGAGGDVSTAACPSARSRWPGWCWPATPTGRSGHGCSSRRRPSSTTSPASAPSSARPPGPSSWPRCGACSATLTCRMSVAGPTAHMLAPPSALWSPIDTPRGTGVAPMLRWGPPAAQYATCPDRRWQGPEEGPENAARTVVRASSQLTSSRSSLGNQATSRSINVNQIGPRRRLHPGRPRRRGRLRGLRRGLRASRRSGRVQDRSAPAGRTRRRRPWSGTSRPRR